MKGIAGGLVLGASLLALAPLARAGEAADGQTEAGNRLLQVQAELEAQRLQIAELQARLAPAPAAEEGGGGGMGDAIKKYLESEEGRKALSKAVAAEGFLKAGAGTMKFGLLAQFWYTQTRNTRSGTTVSGQDSFRIRRLEMAFSGDVVKDQISWLVMVDPARALANDETTDQSKRILQDFKIVYKGLFGAPKDVSLTVGQYKVPFGHDATSSTSVMELVDRSEGAKVFSDSRKPGVMLDGKVMRGAIQLVGSANQSRGQNSNVDYQDEKDLCGRVVVHPWKFAGSEDQVKNREAQLGELLIAGSYLHGDMTANSDRYRDYAVQGEWRKSKVLTDKGSAFFLTEWFKRDPSETSITEVRSHFYEAGFRHGDWEVVGRQDEYTDNTGADRTIHTAGVNYYIKGKCKISLDYIRTRTESGLLPAVWILQFQAAF